MQIFKNLLFVFSVLLLLGCSKIKPSGTIEVNNLSVKNFKKIALTGKFRAFYIHSDKNFVEVETYPNLFHNLKIEVKNQTLTIEEKRKVATTDFYNVMIYSATNPQNIALSDSVEFNVSGEINAKNLHISLKNNAKFIGSLRTDKTILEMKNTSLANFKGFSHSVDMKLADTANLLAPYWQIDNLKIDFKNGGYAEVQVKDSIKGKIQNTAKFLYYDDPVRAFQIDKNTTVTNKKLN